MKLNLQPVEVTPEVDAVYVRLELPVRYADDDIPNNFPGRKGDMWDVVIELETGKISPSGVACDMDMKVVDMGRYTLLDKNKNPIAIVDEDYVPHGIVPGSYGDYVELHIGADGIIANWPNEFDASAFKPIQD